MVKNDSLSAGWHSYVIHVASHFYVDKRDVEPFRQCDEELMHASSAKVLNVQRSKDIGASCKSITLSCFEAAADPLLSLNCLLYPKLHNFMRL